MTNAIKEQLAIEAKNLMEDRFSWIPDDEVVRESFHSIQREVTAAGNVRFDAERSDATGHADDFWAHALSIHAAGNDAGDTWVHSSPLSVVQASQYGPYTESLHSVINKY